MANEKNIYGTRKRGNNLCEVIQEIDNNKNIYALNFGQHIYEKEKEGNTDYQRGIIVFGVTKKGKTKEEIEYALKDAMDKNFNNTDYYYKDYTITGEDGITLEPKRTK